MNNVEKKDDFITHGHAKNRLRYHIILSTKYRRGCLSGIESTVYDVFRGVEGKSDFKIVEMGIDEGDHVHLVVKTKPSLSPDQIVRRLKQLSTRELWVRESLHLKRFYWKKKVLWSSGYFVSTVGSVSDKVVLDYVRTQAKGIV